MLFYFARSFLGANQVWSIRGFKHFLSVRTTKFLLFWGDESLYARKEACQRWFVTIIFLQWYTLFTTCFLYLLDFRKLCMQSTEFHFTDLDKQISAIEHVLNKRPCRTRTVRTASVLQRAGSDQSTQAAATTTNLLQTGKKNALFLFYFSKLKVPLGKLIAFVYFRLFNFICFNWWTEFALSLNNRTLHLTTRNDRSVIWQKKLVLKIKWNKIYVAFLWHCQLSNLRLIPHWSTVRIGNFSRCKIFNFSWVRNCRSFSHC